MSAKLPFQAVDGRAALLHEEGGEGSWNAGVSPRYGTVCASFRAVFSSMSRREVVWLG